MQRAGCHPTGAGISSGCRCLTNLPSPVDPGDIRLLGACQLPTIIVVWSSRKPGTHLFRCARPLRWEVSWAFLCIFFCSLFSFHFFLLIFFCFLILAVPKQQKKKQLRLASRLTRSRRMRYPNQVRLANIIVRRNHRLVRYHWINIPYPCTPLTVTAGGVSSTCGQTMCGTTSRDLVRLATK